MIAYFRRKEYEDTDRAILENRNDVLSVLYGSITERNRSLYCGDVNLSSVDVMYFRAVGGQYNIVNSLVRLAIENCIPVVDEYLTGGATPRTKRLMHEILDALSDIEQPEYFHINGLNHVYENARAANILPPFVLKVSRHGRQGMGTFLINREDDIDEVKRILEHRRNNDEKNFYNLGDVEWIVQEYIPNRGDYRAFVIGDECIGVTKRGPKDAGIVMNRSTRGSRRFRNNRWPQSIGDIATKAAKALGVTIAGVDIIREANTGQPFVIEVNEAPRFKTFSSVTRIDVGAEIVRYLRGLANERT